MKQNVSSSTLKAALSLQPPLHKETDLVFCADSLSPPLFLAPVCRHPRAAAARHPPAPRHAPRPSGGSYKRQVTNEAERPKPTREKQSKRPVPLPPPTPPSTLERALSACQGVGGVQAERAAWHAPSVDAKPPRREKEKRRGPSLTHTGPHPHPTRTLATLASSRRSRSPGLWPPHPRADVFPFHGPNGGPRPRPPDQDAGAGGRPGSVVCG